MTPTTAIRFKHLVRVVDERAGARSLPLLAVSIHRGVVRRSELTDDEPRAEDLSAYKIVLKGEIAVNRMRAFQGAVGIAPMDGIVSPDYLVLAPVAIDPRFLHHLLRSHWFVGQMTSRLRGIGSTDQGNVRTPRINADDLGEIVLHLPSDPEQRAIADYLDTETARIDALIVKKRRMIDLLDEAKASIMLTAVGGGLTSRAGFSASRLPWLADTPSHWRTALLRLVARTGTGHTPSREHPEWWIDCTIPWITTGEVAQVRSDEVEVIMETRECISEIGMANSSATLHPAGTVVLCRTASAGYSAIMGADMATSQDFATWTCGPELRPRFLLLCLRAMRSDLLGRLAMGSTHKTIYMPDIHAISVPLPPMDEQNAIVDAAHERSTHIFTARQALTKQIELLQEHRQALITAAVTGELEIPGVAA